MSGKEREESCKDNKIEIPTKQFVYFAQKQGLWPDNSKLDRNTRPNKILKPYHHLPALFPIFGVGAMWTFIRSIIPNTDKSQTRLEMAVVINNALDKYQNQ